MSALSPTDSAFLWMETRSQPMHVAGLNIYSPPKGAGPSFVTDLLQEWGTHLQALAPFNLRPVLRMGMWHWEEDPYFELDYHLRHLALPHPGRIRELLAMVSRLHGNLMDRSRPLWESYVIEGLPGGRFAIYTKIHHALVDGVTGARIMAEGLSKDTASHKPPFWNQTFTRAPGQRRVSKPISLLQQLGNLAKAGREILPGVGHGLADMARALTETKPVGLTFQAPASALNVEISSSRRFAAQTYSLARIKALGRVHGATVNDVTLAICAGVLRRYLQSQNKLPRKPLVAMVPVSLHGETDLGGNQVTLLLASLGTHLADPAKRLAHIIASTTAAKEKLAAMPRLQKMAYGMTTVAPMGPAVITGVAKKLPAFNVVISNVPGPQEPLYLNGAHLDEVYPVSIVTHYLALNITISGYADQLGFGYIACRRSVPQLQRMLDYTLEAIVELEDAAPSQTIATVPKTPAKRRVAAKPKPKPKTKANHQTTSAEA
jgi:diacylglycerol O-acyltransferase / wax synthase